MTVGRFLLATLVACSALIGIARAQERPNFQEAVRTFNAMPLPTRYNVQMLLIASGFLDAVCNDEYNTRIYDATTNFQVQNRPYGRSSRVRAAATSGTGRSSSQQVAT